MPLPPIERIIDLTRGTVNESARATGGMAGVLFEIEADVNPAPLEIPVRAEWFMIIAVYAGGWGIPSSTKTSIPFRTREAAAKAANELAPGWSNCRIVRIPGEGQEAQG